MDASMTSSPPPTNEATPTATLAGVTAIPPAQRLALPWLLIGLLVLSVLRGGGFKFEVQRKSLTG